MFEKRYVNMQNICKIFLHMLDILTYVRYVEGLMSQMGALRVDEQLR